MLLLTMGAGTAGADPSTPPKDTKLDIFLDVSISPAVVTAGDLITIDGTITDENTTPISGAKLSILVDDKESKDSLVVSGDDGTFQTFAEIRPDAPVGETQLVVSFPGSSSYTAGLKEFDVTVEEPVADEEPEATDAPASTADAEPSATANASGNPTEDTTTDPIPETAPADPAPLSWFYLVLITLGGAAVLVAAALVFRGRYGHKAPTPLDEHELGSLLVPDDASEAGEDEEGALLSESFSEEDPDVEDSDEDPAPDRDST